MADTVVVLKRSTYELYSNSDDEQVRRYALENPEEGKRLLRSHEAHLRSIDAVISALEQRGLRYEKIYRAKLGCTDGKQLIITVGGDGTLIDASHYTTGTPIIGVNSDPGNSVGHFCCYTSQDIGRCLDSLEAQPRAMLHRLALDLDGRRLQEQALNDVLIHHASPAANMRYVISDVSERHYDSGLLVSTASGSSAYMWQEGGILMPLDSKQLQYCPLSKRDRSHRFAEALTVVSCTREGEIFIDGDHTKYDFGLGSTLRMTPGEPLVVVGDLCRNRERAMRVQRHP